MKCHYAVVRVGELPLLRECSLHSPRPVSTSDVSLLPCPILEPKAHLLFHDAYNCGTLSFLPFLAVWCISRGQCCVFCISQKPQSCSCYCWLLAGTIARYITRLLLQRLLQGKEHEGFCTIFQLFFQCTPL